MKKYIAPVCKSLFLDAEFNMMMTASDGYADTTEKFSNRRSASETIWGFDDDAENRSNF